MERKWLVLAIVVIFVALSFLVSALILLSPLPNISVIAYDSSGALIDNQTTNAQGNTTLTLIEYVNNGGTRTYYSNYTINATGKGWTSNSTSFNLTGNMAILFLLTDLIPPELVKIDHPQSIYYPTNESLSLNFSVIDYGVGLSTCWYCIFNETTNVTRNITIPSCQNITFNISDEHEFTLYLYANDTNDNVNFSSVIFAVSTSKPSIELNYPVLTSGLLANSWLNYKTNVYFNFTATQSKGLSSCELWGNWTGNWAKNYTWLSPTNATMNYTQVNLTDGFYKYNVWCNNTIDTKTFAYLNQSFGIDTILPDAQIKTANETIVESLAITISYNITDLNMYKCYFTLRDSTGAVYNYPENTTLSCPLKSVSISAPLYGDYTFQIWGEDKAMNLNSSTISFTLESPVPSIPGGTAPESSSSAICIQTNLTLTQLDRCKIYARLREYCLNYSVSKSSCVLTDTLSPTGFSIKSRLLNLLNSQGVTLTLQQLNELVDLYNSQQFEEIKISNENIEKYGLFSAKLELIAPKFSVSPSRLDTFYLILREGSKFEYIVKAGKSLKSVGVIEGDLGLKSELVSDSTARITYIFPKFPPDFITKTITGKVEYISVDDEPVFQDVVIRAIYLSKSTLSYIGIGIFVASGIIVLIAYRKSIFRRKN